MESFCGQSVVKKMSLFCSIKEGVSYLFLSATTYLLFCHVKPPSRSAIPHVCCRPSNGRKMQALTAVEWLTAVRYETDGRLANGWTDGLPENRLTGLGAGLPLTNTDLSTDTLYKCVRSRKRSKHEKHCQANEPRVITSSQYYRTDTSRSSLFLLGGASK